MPEQKIWGTDECIWKGQGVEVHLLKLKPNDGKPVCCSWHKHEHKHNEFSVLDGRLVVVWAERDDGSKTSGECIPGGEECCIPPGFWHRFEVHEPATVIEVTWVDTVPVDIDRADVGHILEDE